MSRLRALAQLLAHVNVDEDQHVPAMPPLCQWPAFCAVARSGGVCDALERLIFAAAAASEATAWRLPVLRMCLAVAAHWRVANPVQWSPRQTLGDDTAVDNCLIAAPTAALLALSPGTVLETLLLPAPVADAAPPAPRELVRLASTSAALRCALVDAATAGAVTSSTAPTEPYTCPALRALVEEATHAADTPGADQYVAWTVYKALATTLSGNDMVSRCVSLLRGANESPMLSQLQHGAALALGSACDRDSSLRSLAPDLREAVRSLQGHPAIGEVQQRAGVGPRSTTTAVRVGASMWLQRVEAAVKGEGLSATELQSLIDAAPNRQRQEGTDARVTALVSAIDACSRLSTESPSDARLRRHCGWVLSAVFRQLTVQGVANQIRHPGCAQVLQWDLRSPPYMGTASSVYDAWAAWVLACRRALVPSVSDFDSEAESKGDDGEPAVHEAIHHAEGRVYARWATQVVDTPPDALSEVLYMARVNAIESWFAAHSLLRLRALAQFHEASRALRTRRWASIAVTRWALVPHVALALSQPAMGGCPSPVVCRSDGVQTCVWESIATLWLTAWHAQGRQRACVAGVGSLPSPCATFLLAHLLRGAVLTALRSACEVEQQNCNTEDRAVAWWRVAADVAVTVRTTVDASDGSPPPAILQDQLISAALAAVGQGDAQSALQAAVADGNYGTRSSCACHVPAPPMEDNDDDDESV